MTLNIVVILVLHFLKERPIGYVFVSAISVISFEVLTGYVVFLFLKEEGKIARSLIRKFNIIEN